MPQLPKENEDVGVDEVGISDELIELLHSGETTRAEQLLQENDINYTVARSQPGVRVEQPGNGGVSIQGNYPRSESELSVWLAQAGGDDYYVTGRCELSGYDFSIRDAPIVEDACGIVFDSSEWSALEPSEDGVSYYDPGGHRIEHKEYNPNYGVAATVDLSYLMPEDDHVAMTTKLTMANTGNDNIPVQFAYEHTFAYADVPLVGGVSVSLAGGVLSVSLPTGAYTAWDEEITAAP